MAELNDTDLLLVNRNETAATIQSSELMASLEETDYMLVNRNEQTYKITGADLIDSLIDPLELSPVVAYDVGLDSLLPAVQRDNAL